MEYGITVTVTVNEKDCQYSGDLGVTPADWFVGFFILFVLLLVLCGTMYDALQRQHKKTHCIHTIRGRLLMCFSLITNWERLSILSDSQDSKSLRCIQGMRSLSIVIVIIAHTIFWTIRGPIQNPEWVEQSYENIFRVSLLNGNAVMETFLSISGFLLGYMFIKDVNTRGSFSFFDFLNVIAHRYISKRKTSFGFIFCYRYCHYLSKILLPHLKGRLTPVYAVILALSCSWFNHMGRGPTWPNVVTKENEDCNESWWLHLLYLNNYFSPASTCMIHTWYLAVDFQCYFVSMLILLTA
ncbi:hypothetical protein L9F63_024003, partial [Diploptera punctata]